MKKTIEQIVTEQRSITDPAEAEDRHLTDDEAAQWEALESELKAAQRSEEIRKRQAAYEAPSGSLAAVVNVTSVKQDDTLERAFDSYVRTGQANADIAELRAQGTGTGSTGGYLVPTTLLNKITDRKKRYGGVAGVVNVQPSDNGAPWQWPNLDDTANSGVIKAENAAPTSGGADLVYGRKSLGSFTYTAPGAGNTPLLVSAEMLQDSMFDIEGLIAKKLGQRIARKQARDWVNGAGTTEPFGLATGTAVAANTFDNAAPTYADLLNAVHQVDPDYRDQAVWTFNDYTLSLIEGILDANGRPLLNSANDGISVGRSNQYLLGYPIVIDQAWANYADGGTNKWGAFGDLESGYIIRQISGAELIVNPYTHANEGAVEYTLRMRADGTIDDQNAFRVLQNEVS
ncbi:phage major capsid protein [Mycolicibacterium sp. Y3]